MGTKALELELANKGKGCLGKAAQDEPVFILRAQDTFAPSTVRLWADKVAMYHVEGSLASKVVDARALADQMEAWQATNSKKVPD